MEFLLQQPDYEFSNELICSVVEQCFTSNQFNDYYYNDNEFSNNYNYNRFLQDPSSSSSSLPIMDDDDDGPRFVTAGANADDATWILTSSFVILTMQTGFALLETGSSSRGYEVNILMKNVVDVVFGAISYYIVGYGFSFGTPANGFIGMGDFAPHTFVAAEIFGTPLNDTGTRSGALFSRYIFQLSFAATSTTIVSGCVAMRMKFFVYCAYAFFAVIPYAICAHWVFDENGWLAQMGVQDFAGGSAVHLLGAMNGLIAILWLGPRTGRFDPNVNPREFDAVSPTDSLFGLFMLWWGWIGFNCGSSFGITEDRWIIATRAAITTINSSSAGGITGILLSLIRSSGREVRVDDVVNSILGALVAITPTCASVRSYDAYIIGCGGALSALLLNRLMFKLKIDDPVGAIGVHGGAAIWGLLSDGFFSDSTLPASSARDGLFYGGDGYLLKVQCIAIISVIVWSICIISPFFYIVGVAVNGWNWKDPRAGLRVSPREEKSGADLHLHGLGSVDGSISQRDIDNNNNNNNNGQGDDKYNNKKDDDDNNNNNNNDENNDNGFRTYQVPMADQPQEHWQQQSQQQQQDDSITTGQDTSLITEPPLYNMDDKKKRLEQDIESLQGYNNRSGSDDDLSHGYGIVKPTLVIAQPPTTVATTTTTTPTKLKTSNPPITITTTAPSSKRTNTSKLDSSNLHHGSKNKSSSSSTIRHYTSSNRSNYANPSPSDLAAVLANELSREQLYSILAAIQQAQSQQNQQSSSTVRRGVFPSHQQEKSHDSIVWS